MGFGVALRIAGRSVRANVLPMVLLWTASVALVVGFFLVPAFRAALDPLGRWQTERGWFAAFLNRFFFCGIVPGAFMLTMKTLKVRCPSGAIAAQTLWSGVCGIVSGWMFTLHARWFGTGVDLQTLVVKTVIQQFVWTPLFFAPVGAVVYLWIGRDFSFASVYEALSSGFWCRSVFPNLLANWIIWMPCALLIHMFPTPLQIQLTGLVNAFLCLVLLMIGKRKWCAKRSLAGLVE